MIATQLINPASDTTSVASCFALEYSINTNISQDIQVVVSSTSADHELDDLIQHQGEQASEKLLVEKRTTLSLDVFEGLFTDTRWTRLKPLLVMAILAGVIVLQISIVLIPVWLTNYDDPWTGFELDNTARTIYTTGVTIAASIVSAIVSGQSRRMWLKRLASDDVREAQVLLQIGRAKDQFRLYRITLSLVIFSLITASITGSTAIGKQERSGATASELAVEYPPTYKYPYKIGNLCWSTITIQSTSGLTWSIDGYNVSSSNNTGCAGSFIDIVNSLVLVLGNGYTNALYAGQNICQSTIGGQVACSAMGAPLTNAPTCNLFYSLRCLQNAKACAPVFIRNPVACESTLDGASSDVTVQANKLTIGYTTGAPGDLKFTISTSDQHTGGVLWDLVGANETTLINETYVDGYPDFQTHTLTLLCTLSLNDTIDNQIVTNTTITPRGYPFYEAVPELYSTGEKCDGVPMANLTTVSTRLTAASMLTHLIEAPAWIDTLTDIAHDTYTPPNTFVNSNNTLEDIIGVYLASAMAYYWGNITTNIGVASMPVNCTIPADRVGSGKTVNVLYILPSALALIIILYLWITERRQMSSEKGETGESRTKNA